TDGVERAAGIFLGIVAVLTFVEAVLRYGFSTQIPDWYVFGGLLQGVAIFWGVAPATYSGQHIAVDGLWQVAGPLGRRLIDLFADSVTALFLGAFTWMLVPKVWATYQSNQQTAEIGFPIWPFAAVAALGIGGAMLLGLIRLYRTATRSYDEDETVPVDEIS